MQIFLMSISCMQSIRLFQQVDFPAYALSMHRLYNVAKFNKQRFANPSFLA